ncbi:MAG: aldehyde dehydrogenase [Burkholderiales bacterium]|nr:aldehyde dehydrogenase [Burkholderiales bacterium]
MDSPTVAGAVERKPFLIDGRWIDNGGEPLLPVDPAHGRISYAVCAASASDADDAVRAARRAAGQAGWRNMLPHERGRLLSSIAGGIDNASEELAQLQMRENGKVLQECRAQAKSAATTFRYYAAVCESAGDVLNPPRGNYLSMSVHEPYGVVAAITPWNSPLTMEAQKVAPALAAGNAVVLKPSEVTPSTALALGRIALEAGLPPGLLNVLPGDGAVVGAALVSHPGVGMVSFTGGTESGRRIAGAAAMRLIPAALELGGKSPHVVFADADIDAAVRGVAAGIFEGSGQSCIAGSRLFVERSVHARVLDMITRHAQSLRVDLPDRAGAEMGSMASFAHRERVESHVERARAAGADIAAGGSRPSDERFRDGAFYLPTVITGVTNDDAICQEEIFGPVLCVLPFDDEEDLVAQANATAYGLAAGIWTSSYPKAWRVARRIDAGTVWINTYKQLSIAAPFGGYKSSGIGREKGIEGMRLYQQVKSVFWGLDRQEAAA